MQSSIFFFILFYFFLLFEDVDFVIITDYLKNLFSKIFICVAFFVLMFITDLY